MPDPTACKSLGTSSPVWLPGVVSALCFEETMAPREHHSKELHLLWVIWQTQHLWWLSIVLRKTITTSGWRIKDKEREHLGLWLHHTCLKQQSCLLLPAPLLALLPELVESEESSSFFGSLDVVKAVCCHTPIRYLEMSLKGINITTDASRQFCSQPRKRGKRLS